MKKKVNFIIPVRTYSKLNAREHWGKRSRRSASERQAAFVYTPLAAKDLSRPIRITLTRCGPRTLDTDNLAGSQKAIRDGIADRLGIDDGSELLEWVYKQQKSKRHEVEVDIEELEQP